MLDKMQSYLKSSGRPTNEKSMLHVHVNYSIN